MTATIGSLFLVLPEKSCRASCANRLFRALRSPLIFVIRRFGAGHCWSVRPRNRNEAATCCAPPFDRLFAPVALPTVRFRVAYEEGSNRGGQNQRALQRPRHRDAGNGPRAGPRDCVDQRALAGASFAPGLLPGQTELMGQNYVEPAEEKLPTSER